MSTLVSDEWKVLPIVDSESLMVAIEPPKAIDKLYDDLWLEVTGNMTFEEKREVAQLVCDLLNEVKENEYK